MQQSGLEVRIGERKNQVAPLDLPERLVEMVPGSVLLALRAPDVLALDLLDEVQYDSLFSFKYSPRPNTSALAYADHISEEEKSRRLAVVMEKQRAIQIRRNAELIGSIAPVTITEIGSNSLFGVLANGCPPKAPTQSLRSSTAIIKTLGRPAARVVAGANARRRMQPRARTSIDMKRMGRTGIATESATESGCVDRGPVSRARACVLRRAIKSVPTMFMLVCAPIPAARSP